jgi:hypothetical protein
MKEIINSILDSTKDRLKNPLLGAFVFSWLIFNWKPLFYILFSNNSIENKINFITECYCSINNNFWFPLVFSIFYIVMFPYILWGFDKLSSKAIIGRKDNILNLNISDIKNQQKIAFEESELENIKASYRDKADLNKKIEILNNQLTEKDEIINIQNFELNQVKNDQTRLRDFIKTNTDSNLNDKEKINLQNQFLEFKKSDIYRFFREIGTDISRRNTLPNNIDDLVIEKYRLNEIIKEIRDEENNRLYYKFTPKGESFWKQYIMSITFLDKSNEKVEDEPDDLPF